MKHTIPSTAAILFAWSSALGAPMAPAAELPSQLDLRGAIVYALDHNYAIRQARETIRLQEGIILQVQGQQLPNLGAQGQWQRNEASISQSYPQTNSNWGIELKATQALFAGGGIQSAVKGAKLTRDAATYDLQTSIDSALLDVRTKFYNVLLAREKIRVEEENVKLYEHQLEDTKNQFDTGTVSNFEVLTAQVQLANAEPPLITARNGYRLAIDQLRQSLGYSNTTPGNVDKIPTFAGSLDVTPATYDLEKAIETARAQRPELQRLATLEDADKENVVISEAGGRPSVALVGSYQYFQNLLPGAPNQTFDGWTVGLQGSWAIFDGEATQGRVAQPKSQLEQARLTRLNQTLAIEVQVRAAVSSLQQAAELVAAAQQVVGQAEEALRLANARFAAGTATQLDVLTADVARTQARYNQLSANYNYNVALATLRTAIGEADAYAPTQ